MRALRHVFQQPFISATGLAALVHSTWSLGTLFTGVEPEQFTAEWFAWLTPAFLIAFALDVGQIATSAEIRAGNRARMKYATFAVFAIATYYLQWLYISHHMPALQLAPGVRTEWYGAAQLIRDAAIWFIPALLPLSTLLYTFSGYENHAQQPVIAVEKPKNVSAPLPALDAPQDDQCCTDLTDGRLERTGDGVKVACTRCNSWSKVYETESSARRGLRAHHQACYRPEELPVWLIENTNQNGHKSDLLD